MSITDVDLGQAWLSLSLTNKMFFLYFCGVAIYTLSLCLYAFFHLHSLKKRFANESANPAWSTCGVLTRHLASLRQLHLLTLYLFGFCIAFSIPGAFVTIGTSKALPIGAFIQTVTFLLCFDAAIFLGFAFFHSLQWVVSSRVDSFARRHG